METYEYKTMAQVENKHWWFVARRGFVHAVLDHFGVRPGQKKRIVDIGAGTGGMIHFLSQFGKTVGVEPNSEGRKYARKRKITLKKGFADKTGLPSNSYDIVCFFDVLYHQGIDEAAALREAQRLLKKGGMLVITDCAFPFLTSPHDVHVMGRTRYTTATIAQAVRGQNFKIKYVSYTFFLVFPFVVVWRLLQSIVWKLSGKLPDHSDVAPLPMWLNWLLIYICRFEESLYGIVRYAWGSSLMLVATK